MAKHASALAACCICLISLAGCNDPGMSIAVQPFATYPMTAEGAYKVRLGISDTKEELFGMMDVAIGLDLEFSTFEDADGETVFSFRFDGDFSFDGDHFIMPHLRQDGLDFSELSCEVATGDDLPAPSGNSDGSDL